MYVFGFVQNTISMTIICCNMHKKTKENQSTKQPKNYQLHQHKSVQINSELFPKNAENKHCTLELM